MNDPAAVWYFNWSLENLSATSLHALSGCVNVADVEVVEPEGNRHSASFGDHAADRLPSNGELLIGSQRADCGIRLLPPKKLTIKG